MGGLFRGSLTGIRFGQSLAPLRALACTSICDCQAGVLKIFVAYDSMIRCDEVSSYLIVPIQYIVCSTV